MITATEYRTWAEASRLLFACRSIMSNQNVNGPNTRPFPQDVPYWPEQLPTPDNDPSSARSRSLAWTKIPLIAFALFSIGPALIYVFLYGVYVTLDWEPSGWANRFDSSVLESPLPFMLATWPFLVLFLVCNNKAKKQGSDSHSLKFAMWTSLIAMSLPNSVLLITSPDLISHWNVPAAGLGLGIAFGGAMFVVPVLGLIGWFLGRMIAWYVSDFLVYSRIRDRRRRG